MQNRNEGFFPVNCPKSSCPSHSEEGNLSPATRRIVRRGFFYRRRPLARPERLQRYFCHACRSSFSSATLEPEYRQKKRHLNATVSLLLTSLQSQTRISLILGVNP